MSDGFIVKTFAHRHRHRPSRRCGDAEETSVGLVQLFEAREPLRVWQPTDPDETLKLLMMRMSSQMRPRKHG